MVLSGNLDGLGTPAQSIRRFFQCLRVFREETYADHGWYTVPVSHGSIPLVVLPLLVYAVLKCTMLSLVHAYTAAIIQAAVLLRLPHSMMSDDIRRDFDESFRVIEGMSEKSGMAKRAMPMLRKLKDRIEPVREPSANALAGRGLWTERAHEQSAQASAQG